uniref:Uncharacterized protein n=1 Tax=Meleagris gallopavo TaxID=9103 RepID=H9H2D0_MELGA
MLCHAVLCPCCIWLQAPRRSSTSGLPPIPTAPQCHGAGTIYCAVSEEVSGISGKYFDSDCSLTLPSAAARDAGLARKLWEESERLTGLSS